MSYYFYPPETGGGSQEIAKYPTFSSFPPASTAGNGALALALDTGILYESDGTTWRPIGGPGVALSIGTFDSGTASVNGAHIDSNQLIMQSATASVPGLVNIGTQTFGGAKTFSGAVTFSSTVNLSSLTASLPLQLDASKNVISAAINLSGSQATGILAAARFPALTGDVTTSAGSVATSLVATSNATLTTLSALTTAASLSTVGTITTGVWNGTTIAINRGGTGVTSVTTVPGATVWAGWDANKDMSANNFLPGFTTTATAAGTTTLTVASTELNYFTGTTTQTVVLPVVSTLVLGFSFTIVNQSTGALTVNSSGGNLVQTMVANTWARFTCILTTGTTAASWAVQYSFSGGGITALTGDVTATGPGSAVASLVATTNSTLTTLSGLTTAANLATVGTITTGTWNATTIAVNRGGTGLTSGTSGGILGFTGTTTLASSALLTANQLIIGGGAGATPSTLAAGTTGQYLRMNATPVPAWFTILTPTIQKFTSGSGTYTTPANVRWLRVRIVGAGGGGSAGGAATPGNGGNGGNTTFGTSLLVANGGSGGVWNSPSNAGGTASITAPAIGTAIQGEGTTPGPGGFATTNGCGGSGGSSPFGGAGPGAYANNAGNAAIANSGSGGGGGGSNTTLSSAWGQGGGAGGFVDAIIPATVSATYSYAVGAAGTAGVVGSGGGTVGGAGGSGYIEVTEYYV